MVREEENAGYQHFLLFPLCFFLRVVESQGCLVTCIQQATWPITVRMFSNTIKKKIKGNTENK